MGREKRAREERRARLEALKLKSPPIERLAARLEFERARAAHAKALARV